MSRAPIVGVPVAVPPLREHVRERDVEYDRVWACNPPPFGAVYVVTDLEWDAEYGVQTVHGWRLVGMCARGELPEVRG